MSGTTKNSGIIQGINFFKLFTEESFYSANLKKPHVTIKADDMLTSDADLDEGDILELVYQHIEQVMRFDSMYIALYDENKTELNFPIAVEGGKCVNYSPQIVDISDPAKGGLIEYVLRNRESLNISNIQKFSLKNGLKKALLPIPKSWLGVPMLFKKKPFGIIVLIDNHEKDKYHQDDLEILQAIIGQAVMAIYNIKLINQRKELLKLLRRPQNDNPWGNLEELAGSLAHRIGNKGGTIRLKEQELSEYLRTALPEDEYSQEILSIINRNNQYLLELSQTLLRPFHASKEPLGRSTVEILLNGVLRNTEFPQDVTVNVNYIRTPPEIKANRALIEVFHELIANALDAMQMSICKTLTIEVTYDDRWVSISFTDTGTNILNDKPNEIFELFSKRKKNVDKNQFGFGLWWVKTFLNNINADIRVESLDTGTRFTVLLLREDGV